MNVTVKIMYCHQACCETSCSFGSLCL